MRGAFSPLYSLPSESAAHACADGYANGIEYGTLADVAYQGFGVLALYGRFSPL